MVDLRFEKNMAIEFIASVWRYMARGETDDWGWRSPHEEIVDWVVSVDNNISAFFKNDIDLIGRMEGMLFFLMSHTISQGLMTPQDILKSIHNMTGTELMSKYLQILGSKYEPFSLADVERIEQILKHEFENQNNVDLVMEALRNPDELRDRLYMTLSTFYHRYFSSREQFASDFLDQKLIEHRKQFEDDPELYVDTVFHMHSEDLTEKDSSLTAYVTYHGEQLFLYLSGKTTHTEPIIVYGFAREQALTKELASRERLALFKTLSDRARLEIIEVLGDKEWYGNELAQHLGLTNATVSYHLSKLMDLRIVVFKQGPRARIYYRLQKDRLQQLFSDALRSLIKEDL